MGERAVAIDAVDLPAGSVGVGVQQRSEGVANTETIVDVANAPTAEVDIDDTLGRDGRVLTDVGNAGSDTGDPRGDADTEPEEVTVGCGLAEAQAEGRRPMLPQRPGKRVPTPTRVKPPPLAGGRSARHRRRHGRDKA